MLCERGMSECFCFKKGRKKNWVVHAVNVELVHQVSLPEPSREAFFVSIA